MQKKKKMLNENFELIWVIPSEVTYIYKFQFLGESMIAHWVNDHNCIVENFLWPVLQNFWFEVEL